MQPPQQPVGPWPDRMEVKNWARWGELVKCWSTDRPHPADGRTYPVPRTSAELRAQCDGDGTPQNPGLSIGLTLPEHVEDLVVFTHGKGTMVLRVPPKELILSAEEHLKAGGATWLPTFYTDAFGLPEIDPQDPLAFQAARIGDYSIANCGG
jgi:hypothetical protein